MDNCYDAISLTFVGSDGGTLATDTSSAGGRCAHIETQAQAHTLRVEKPGSSSGGDFFLRFSQAP